MSILIKMEMPKNCMTCPFVTEFAQCTLTDKRWIKMRMAFDNRLDDCPLIEVPKHGRLIEDTVLDNMSTWNTDREYDRGWDSAVQAAKNRIKTAPTIIEAEADK